MSGAISIGATSVQLTAVGQYMQQGGPYPLNDTRYNQQTMYIRGDPDPSTPGQQRRMSSFQQKNLIYYQGQGWYGLIQAPQPQTFINVQANGPIIGGGGATQSGLPGGTPGFAGLSIQTGTTVYAALRGVTGIYGGGGGGAPGPAGGSGGNGAPAVSIQGGGSVVYQGPTGTLYGGGGGGGGGGYSASPAQVIYSGGGGGGGAGLGAPNGTLTAGGVGGLSPWSPTGVYSAGGAGGGLGQPGQAGVPGQDPRPNGPPSHITSGSAGGAGGQGTAQGSFVSG